MKTINFVLSSMLAFTVAAPVIAQDSANGQLDSQSQPRLRINYPKHLVKDSVPIPTLPPTVPANRGQPFYQGQPRVNLSSAPQASGSTTKSAP